MKKNMLMKSLIVIIMLMSMLTCCNTKAKGDIALPNKQDIIESSNEKEVNNREEGREPKGLLLTEKQKGYAQATRTFAFHLLKEVRKDKKEDVLISPLSAAYLLGMLENGASGTTRKQILSAMQMNGCKDPEMNNFFHHILVSSPEVDNSVKFSIANAIMADNQYPLGSEFKKVLSKKYQAYVRIFDFKKTNLVSIINDWASKHTNGKINKMIEKEDPFAVLYGMNALYFKGSWADKFEISETKPGIFKAQNGSKTKVPMMHRLHSYPYDSNDNYSAVRLEYGNGNYNMDIFLPAKGKTITDVISELSEDNKRNEDFKDELVDLKLPRFSSEFSLEMNDALKRMGIVNAFSLSANFSRMNKKLYLSKAIQKCRIDVNEDGSEAAAVSSGLMIAKGCDPVDTYPFHVNRPFVYVISEKTSGIIYFIGVKTNMPGQETTENDNAEDDFVQTNNQSKLKAKKEIPNLVSNDNYVLDVAEQMPSFPGGMEALSTYLKSNTRDPDPNDCMQGRVILTFVVEKSGSITQPVVVRSLDKEYDNEALRVVKNMPRWNPGRQDDEIVRVKYTIAVTFK
jgi:TonB family protein